MFRIILLSPISQCSIGCIENCKVDGCSFAIEWRLLVEQKKIKIVGVNFSTYRTFCNFLIVTKKKYTIVDVTMISKWINEIMVFIAFTLGESQICAECNSINIVSTFRIQKTKQSKCTYVFIRFSLGYSLTFKWEHWNIVFRSFIYS